MSNRIVTPIACIAAFSLSTGMCMAAVPGAQQSTPQFQSGTEKTVVYQTPKGKLVVHSGMSKMPDYGPPPAFSKLDSNGDQRISREEAAAYPPLANDFLHASGDRDKPIRKRQYQRWTEHK